MQALIFIVGRLTHPLLYSNSERGRWKQFVPLFVIYNLYFQQSEKYRRKQLLTFIFFLSENKID